MKNYTVLLSNEAQYDIENLADIIMYKYKAPSTSIKYIQGLINETQKKELDKAERRLEEYLNR